MKRLPFKQRHCYAINERWEPTIWPHLPVIASVLPMGLVSGVLCEPYMSQCLLGFHCHDIVVIVALTITPYLGYIFLREKD